MQALNYQNDKFNITEPFDGLFTQGMVCHETYKDTNNNWLSPDEVTSDGKNFFKKENNETVNVGPSESMSKSKKNTIDPEKIIKNYGADSVRLFIMSDSPPEKDVQWSDTGMEGSYKFLQKLWTLHNTFLNKINSDKNKNKDVDDNISKFTNNLINKITQNIESFRYNVIIANFYEMYNYFSKELKKPYSKTILIENYTKILILLSPFIPHFTSECIEQLNALTKVKNYDTWPKINDKLLMDENINLVVQINGKKREILKIKQNISEKEVLEVIDTNNRIQNFIKGKKIIKKIFVPNKIINLIVK